MSKLKFTTQIPESELYNYSIQLFNNVVQLQLENQRLMDKIEHLEELLMNLDVPNIG